MILRGIYKELGEIFDFRYEKNSNGSVRVNTVIAHLVYPSLYDDDKFTENDICYFLKHREYTYQHYANIRNSFSELMNPKANSNRFPVMEFANLIDINEMYSYYKGLISELDAESKDRINKFIDELMTKESILYSRFKIVCQHEYEFLTWIIIFSMFNENISNEKLHSFNPLPPLPDDDTDDDLSESLQKASSRLTVLTAALITSICLQIIFVFTPQFISGDVKDLCYFLAVLCAFISIIFWVFQGFAGYNYTKLKVGFQFKNSYPGFDTSHMEDKIKIKPHDSILEARRARFRKIYFSICLTLCILSLIPAIILKSFPLFVGFILVFLFIFLCADRIVSSYVYRTYYDSLTHNGKSNPYRGMAKIYRWEYEKTGFDFKNKYYRNKIPVHSIECYKNIFYLSFDRNKWAIVDLYMMIACFNLFFFVIAIFCNVTDDKAIFFRLPGNIDLNLLIMFYIATFGVFYIVTALCIKGYFTGLAYASHGLIHVTKNSGDATKIYLAMQSENYLREIDVARGIYVYNVTHFEKGTPVEDIQPESDRMLYYHQAVDYRLALRMSYCFIYAILFLIPVWHMQNYILFIPLTIIVLIMYIISDKFIIEKIHYREIIREINKLNNINESSGSDTQETLQ